MNRRGGVRLAGVPWAGSVRFACALLGLGVAGCGTDAMPPVVHVFPIREHTLPSGLRVVVEQDDTSMLAGVSWVVDVGQVDSPLGRPELAHAVEHLVLGSPDDEGVSHWERLNALGAVEVNGATSAELTTFQAFAPTQALDQLVAIELARMADPLRGASDELWARERQVVGEELDLRKGGLAATGAPLMMAALFPPTHVLGRDLARTREALKDVTLEDLRQFAASYYRPERMTLVISGAIGPDWDERLWSTMPRALRGQANDRRTPVRRPLAAAVQVVNPVVALGRHTVGVATPELWTGWILPPARGVAALPLQALGDVVGAVLSDAIEQGRIPGVVRAEVAVSPGALASTLICRLLLRADASVDGTVELVKQFVGSLANLRDGYPARFSARVLRLGVLWAAMATESLEARTVARARLVHDDPDASIGGVVMARRKVSAADVEQLATRYLTAGAARSLVLLPTDASARPFRVEGDARLEKGPAGELAARTEPEAEDDDALGVASDGVKRSVLSVAKAPGAGAASVTQLKNGLTLIVLRRPGLPFVSMLLGFHAEPTQEEAPGARVAVGFTRWHDMRQFAADRGVLQNITRDGDSYQESLAMFSADFDQALQLLEDEDETMSVHWPSHAFERWGALGTTLEPTPEWRARRVFGELLWGKHVYGRQPPVDVVLKVTAADVEDWLKRVHRPRNGALVVVGDVDPPALIRQIERRIGGWSGAETPPPAPPPPPLPSVAPLPREGAATVRASVTATNRPTTIVHFGCLLPAVHALRDGVANGLFSQIMDRDVFHRTRIELGATYAPAVWSGSLRGGSAYLEGELDVDRNGLAGALRVLHTWLAVGASIPFAEPAIERTRWRLARRSNLRYDTNGKLARSLFHAWNMGWAPATLDDFPQALAGVSSADLEKVLQTCRASAVISILGNPPAEAAAPRTPLGTAKP